MKNSSIRLAAIISGIIAIAVVIAAIAVSKGHYGSPTLSGQPRMPGAQGQWTTYSDPAGFSFSYPASWPVPQRYESVPGTIGVMFKGISFGVYSGSYFDPKLQRNLTPDEIMNGMLLLAANLRADKPIAAVAPATSTQLVIDGKPAEAFEAQGVFDNSRTRRVFVERSGAPENSFIDIMSGDLVDEITASTSPDAVATSTFDAIVSSFKVVPATASAPSGDASIDSGPYDMSGSFYFNGNGPISLHDGYWIGSSTLGSDIERLVARIARDDHGAPLVVRGDLDGDGADDTVTFLDTFEYSIGNSYWFGNDFNLWEMQFQTPWRLVNVVVTGNGSSTLAYSGGSLSAGQHSSVGIRDGVLSIQTGSGDPQRYHVVEGSLVRMSTTTIDADAQSADASALAVYSDPDYPIQVRYDPAFELGGKGPYDISKTPDTRLILSTPKSWNPASSTVSTAEFAMDATTTPFRTLLKQAIAQGGIPTEVRITGVTAYMMPSYPDCGMGRCYAYVSYMIPKDGNTYRFSMSYSVFNPDRIYEEDSQADMLKEVEAINVQVTAGYEKTFKTILADTFRQ